MSVQNTFNTDEEVKLEAEPRLESYEQAPLEDFGRKMLEDMGWKGEESQEAKGITEPIVFVPR